MVHHPDTLVEQCESIEAALAKLQPRLRMSHLNVLVSPAAKSAVATKCSICACALAKANTKYIATKRVDYEELEISTSSPQAVCLLCSTVSCQSEIMSIYLSETVVSTEETSSQLSTLIDHFLTVNKQDDVGVFNAVLSLSVTLRKTLERLNLATI